MVLYVINDFFATDLPLSEHEQAPNSSYENLRKIVQTIVHEVIKLPEFHNQKGFSNVDANQIQASFEPKVYEDLLATAVINKVSKSHDHTILKLTRFNIDLVPSIHDPTANFR